MWTDATGKDWTTSVNVNTVRRVNELTGVLLTDAADTDLVQRLFSDIMLLCDVLYAVCEPQASERGIDSAAFGELLAGETIDKACDSLMRSIVDFFPSGRRDKVNRILAATRKIEQEQVKLLDQRMSAEQIDKLIAMQAGKANIEIDKILAGLGDDSGKSLASSE